MSSEDHESGALALTELPEWGCLTAPGFPVAAFRPMIDVGKVLAGDDAGYLIRAWMAVAFRHRTCVAESAAFAAALPAIPRDAYPYERALFSFYTAGLSSLESTAFGIHAIGHATRPTNFPMTSSRDLEEVTITKTARRMAATFRKAPVTATLNEVLADPGYQDWCDVRNFLSHRATPGRNITVIVGGPPVADKWGPGGQFGELVPKKTTTALAWLEAWLGRLLADTEQWARPLLLPKG